MPLRERLGIKKASGISSRSSIDDHPSQALRSNPTPPTTSQTANQVATSQGHYLSQEVVQRDLWNEAFASLPQDDRAILRPANGDGTPSDKTSQLAMVEKVMEQTEVKYKRSCERGWHTKKGDTTKETNIRIKAQKIMCAALQFDDIVRAGLKFDPSGYGTTVWGVLSGALALVQNDKDRTDAVFDSAAVLATFLPKYAIIEDHYRDRQTYEQKAFDDQIRDVYASVLKYAACVQKQLDISFTGRLLESLWTLDNQDIKILKDELEKNDERVAQQCHLVAHQYRKQEFQKLDTKALETLTRIEFSVQKILEAEKLRTLNWLSDSALTDKQQQLRSQVDNLNKNSGKWLLDSDEYTSWLTSPHSFLWLHGTSGCGKSMLCSTAVKDLMEFSLEISNMIVTYWYFDNADTQTQNLQRLLRLILRRISARVTPLPEPVRDLANKHEAAGSAPATTALINTLKNTVAAMDEDLYVVLDAIDEYQAGNETLREEFLDFLVELGDAKLAKLHVLVTSVSESDIENALMSLQPRPADMDVEKPVSVDVAAYLDSTIERYGAKKHWSPKIRGEIEKALKDDGRFRIVSLQLEQLRRCRDDGEIEAALNSIPRSIEDAYVRKLRDVAPKDVRRLRYMFYWISVAFRRLTTLDLAAAPGVELPNPEDLSDICPSGMMRFEKQKSSFEDDVSFTQDEQSIFSSMDTDVVTFDHPSVKRFLYSLNPTQSVDDQASQFFLSEKTIHAEFSKLMVDHLLAIEQPSIGSSTVVTTPFTPYAARYWHEHLMNGGDIPDEEVLNSKLLSLFGDPMNPAYLNWIRLWHPEKRKADIELAQENCPSPLYMAMFLGLRGVAKSLIAKRSYINGSGGLLQTNLQLASKRQDIEILEQLIQSGESMDNTPRNQPTALSIAVECGNVKLVQTLLSAGAKPDARDSLEVSALQLASFRGNSSIVRELVASGADVNLQGGFFGTALQAAAAAGHAEIVATLLGNNVNPNAVGGLLATAIQAAETGGHSEVVRQLVDAGVAWDEEKDSIWHEAYDLWISRSSVTEILESFLASEKSLASHNQQMLAGAIKILSSVSPISDGKAFEIRKARTSSGWEPPRAENLKLIELVRRQGQMGMESKHYVYRAFFWALILQCQAESQAFVESIGIDGTIERLAIATLQLNSSQRTVECGDPDHFVAARHELVDCYASALKVASESFKLISRYSDMHPDVRTLHVTAASLQPGHIMDKFERHNRQFESLLRMACLQQTPTADIQSKFHDELWEKAQQEMRESFHALENGMEKRLTELEHRVVGAIQEMLPVIIRDEMRKLLAEQENKAQ